MSTILAEGAAAASSAGRSSTFVVASGHGLRRIVVSRLRLERVHGKRAAVRLRLVLSGPARISFLVIGPAPRCALAGRFAIAGHRGVNKVLFRGRIGGRQLRPGTYTIVPQATARGARRTLPPVAVAIDARGIRPTAPVQWRNCNSATQSHAQASMAHGLPAGPRSGGVAGAAASIPASRAPTSVDRPSRELGSPILPGGTSSWLLGAVLVALLASAVTLLGLAALEPGYAAMRFRVVRLVDSHREEIAFLGVGLLAGTAVLFLLGHLPR